MLLLNILQVSVLFFAAWAVVQCFRHRVSGDAGLWQALGAAGIVGLAALVNVGATTLAAQDARQLGVAAVRVFGVSLLVTAVWAACYAACSFAATGFDPTSGPAVYLTVAYVAKSFAYALAEEIFHRGWVQGILAEHFARFRGGRWAAIVVSALVFMAQHTHAVAQLPMFAGALVAGVVFGIIFEKHGLLVAEAVHFLTNLALFFVPNVSGWVLSV